MDTSRVSNEELRELLKKSYHRFKVVSVLKYTLFFWVVLCLFVDARIVKFSWDGNLEPDLAGYKVYYWTDTSLPPVSTIDVGTQTWYCMDVAEVVGYIGVSAYDTFGNESGYTVAPVIRGDVDRPTEYNGILYPDHQVDGFDLNILATYFGWSVAHRNLDCNVGFAIDPALDSTEPQRADINRDGVVDGFDLMEIGMHWGFVAVPFGLPNM